MIPKNSNAQLILGKIYIHSKEFALAIEAYQKAIALDPSLADAFFNLGFLYASSGMYGEAEKMFAQVVQLQPTYFAKALFNLAAIQEKLGKTEESLENLHMAVKVDPENQKAVNYLKKLEVAGGETQR